MRGGRKERLQGAKAALGSGARMPAACCLRVARGVSLAFMGVASWCGLCASSCSRPLRWKNCSCSLAIATVCVILPCGANPASSSSASTPGSAAMLLPAAGGRGKGRPAGWVHAWGLASGGGRHGGGASAAAGPGAFGDASTRRSCVPTFSKAVQCAVRCCNSSGPDTGLGEQRPRRDKGCVPRLIDQF